jgi:hypothetical protein
VLYTIYTNNFGFLGEVRWEGLMWDVRSVRAKDGAHVVTTEAHVGIRLIYTMHCNTENGGINVF